MCLMGFASWLNFAWEIDRGALMAGLRPALSFKSLVSPLSCLSSWFHHWAFREEACRSGGLWCAQEFLPFATDPLTC